MSVTQVRQAIGSWNVRLRGNIPKSVLTGIEPFGHVAIVPGSVNVNEYGDRLLTAARYVGVYRAQANNTDGVVLSGVGLESWLGDENGAGDVFETALELTNVNFATAMTAALPPGGAITAGTFYSVPGLYTGRHQWVTPRQVLGYISSIFGAEWRVTNTGTLDAGLVADLYVTSPRAILVAKDDSSDLRFRSLPGTATMERANDSYTTRVVVLGEGEGETIQVGTANQPAVPYNDLHGNDVKITRIISESYTSPANVDDRAAILLDQYGAPQQPNVNLSTSHYDMKGTVSVGDYIYIYNPDAGFEDPTNETTWQGEVIHPAKLRVVELSWPIRTGWTVAYRNNAGVWTDLSSYVFYESGDTNIVVGDLPRSLTNGGITEPINDRPSVDTTIPAAPAFTEFNVGSYQSDETNTTKAAIRVAWTTPLNIDGSTIIDGQQYEIRYRVSAVLGYRVKWGQIGVPSSSPYKWGELLGNPWGAPISDPVSDDPQWYYLVSSWGTNEATILELTPGVTYELQIRAVDQSAHLGPYSSSSFVTTVGDLFAPSTPAAPTVAASRIAIQVTHNLGKASGGTFNLEQDLDHLEVHVGGSASFYPDSTTMRGKLPANAAMLGGQIPTVGTFPVEQTDQIHVKVRAVDRSGNKSSASSSATVTAQLIDDAHISDLTVSKVTAGTITANWIMGGTIKTADSGARVQLDSGGVHAYDQNGVEALRMDTAGSYKVLDASAVTQIQMGLLTDGTYGLAAVNPGGQFVKVNNFLFGPQHGYISTDIVSLSTSYHNGSPVGPNLTVEIGTLGKAIVTLSASMIVQNDGASMSVEVNGPTYMPPDIAYHLFLDNRPSTNLFGISSTRVVVFTGLLPGTYTFKAMYKSAAGNFIDIYDRYMLVQPY